MLKKSLARWLSALLAAALLLSCFALAEDDTPEAIAEEAAAEESILTDAIDDMIEEEAEAELDDAPLFEALPAVEETVDLVEEADVDEAEKLMAPAGEIAIDAAHFPDAALRTYISSTFDTDKSGGLSNEELTAEKTRQMELSRQTGFDHDKRIYTTVVDAHSLKGLELFPNLTSLCCGGLSLSSVDISGFPSLINVCFDGCGLTSLVLGSQPKLESLTCMDNQLTALDISRCPNLLSVQCNRNQIASLNIASCPRIIAGVIPTNFYNFNDSITYVDGNTNYLIYDVTTALVGGGSPVSIVKITKTSTTYKTTAGSSFFIYRKGTEAVARAKSSKPKVVSRVNTKYNGAGFIWTANTKGTSKITFKDGRKYTVTVKVGAAATPAAPVVAPENAITVTKNMKTSVLVGTTHQIFLNGKTGKGFKSSKKKVATVDKSGNIAAVGAGKTKITFKVGKKKRTLTLTVVDPTMPTAIYLDKSGTVAAKVGEPQTITAAFPAGTTSDIKWTSSNKKVATVANGVVTFKKKGKVTITATAVKGKKKAKVKFVVSK